MARPKFKDLVATQREEVVGNKGGGDFFKIEEVKFDSSKKDDKKHILLPLDENGEVILWEQPFHRIRPTNKTPNGRGVVELPKRDGGSFTPYEFGCTHRVTERDRDVQAQMKEDNHVCILCDIKNHETRKIWGIINETYPDFNSKTGKQKNEIFVQVDGEVRTLEEAWEFRKDEDGGNTLYINKHNKVLVAELEEDGSFELKVWKLSDSRLKRLNETLAESVDTGVFPEDQTSVLSDVNGEVVYNVGGVQFLVKYPKNASKSQAGRDATFSIVGPNKSLVIQDPSLLEKINEEAQAIINDVEKYVENDFSLRARTEEEVLELIDVEYYESLKRGYPAKDFNADTETKSTTKKAATKKVKAEKVDEAESDADVDSLFDEI